MIGEHITVQIYVEGVHWWKKDCEVIAFIDKCTFCSLPHKPNIDLESSSLVKKVHTNIYRKKRGVTCRFDAGNTPLNETKIIYSTEIVDQTEIKESRKHIDNGLTYIVKIGDVCDITMTEILERQGLF